MQTSLGTLVYAPATDARDTAAQYNEVAPSWDQTLARLGFVEAYRSILNEATSNLRPLDIVESLEIGIVTAEYSAALQEAFSCRRGAMLSVCGVDVSAGMLEIAARKLSALGVPFVGVLANGECLPLPSQCFDVVSAAHVVEHASSPLKLLAEMERVLRPGGIMITMMTRCNPVTRSIQKRWHVQCVRSQKLEAVLRDFGMTDIRVLSYPTGLTCNLLSFCCVATKKLGTT